MTKAEREEIEGRLQRLEGEAEVLRYLLKSVLIETGDPLQNLKESAQRLFDHLHKQKRKGLLHGEVGEAQAAHSLLNELLTALGMPKAKLHDLTLPFLE